MATLERITASLQLQAEDYEAGMFSSDGVNDAESDTSSSMTRKSYSNPTQTKTFNPSIKEVVEIYVSFVGIILAGVGLWAELNYVVTLTREGHRIWSSLMLILVLLSRISVSAFVFYSFAFRFYQTRASRRYPSLVFLLFRFLFLFLAIAGLGNIIPQVLRLYHSVDRCRRRRRQRGRQGDIVPDDIRRLIYRTGITFAFLNAGPLVLFYAYVGFHLREFDLIRGLSWISVMLKLSIFIFDGHVFPLDFQHAVTRVCIRILFCLYYFFSLFLSAPLIAALMECGGRTEVPFLMLASSVTVYLRILDPRYFIDLKKYHLAALLWWSAIAVVPNVAIWGIQKSMEKKYDACIIMRVNFSQGNKSFISNETLDFNSSNSQEMSTTTNFLNSVDLIGQLHEVAFSGVPFAPTLPIAFFIVYQWYLYLKRKKLILASIFMRLKFSSVISAILFLNDLISDVQTGFEHRQNGDNTWSSLTFLFVILPGLVNGVIGLRGRKNLRFFHQKSKQTFLIFLAHIVGLAQLLYILDDFLCNYYNYNIGQGAKACVTARNQQIARFELTTLCLEDFPQASLQMYIIFKRRDSNISYFQIFSIVTSILSASKTLSLNGMTLFKRRFNLHIIEEAPSESYSYRCKLRKIVQVTYEHHATKGFVKSMKGTIGNKYLPVPEPTNDSVIAKCKTILKEIIFNFTTVHAVLISANIFSAIAGVTFLSECAEDGNRLVYVAFPFMIFCRIVFPTDIIFPRKRNVLVNTLITILVLLSPIFIHIGMASRSFKKCPLFQKKTAQVIMAGRTCTWIQSTFCFIVLSGMNSMIICSGLGIMLIVFWAYVFLKNGEKTCDAEQKRHVKNCRCVNDEGSSYPLSSENPVKGEPHRCIICTLLWKIRGFAQDSAAIEVGPAVSSLLSSSSLHKRSEISKLLRSPHSVSEETVDSAVSVIEYCCTYDELFLLKRLEVLQAIFHHGVALKHDNNRNHNNDNIFKNVAGLIQETTLWANDSNLEKFERENRIREAIFAVYKVLMENRTLKLRLLVHFGKSNNSLEEEKALPATLALFGLSKNLEPGAEFNRVLADIETECLEYGEEFEAGVDPEELEDQDLDKETAEVEMQPLRETAETSIRTLNNEETN